MDLKGFRSFPIILKRAGDYALFLVFLAVASYGACMRWLWLKRYTYPIDFSGFYYLQEVSHRLETGQGYYEKVSPFFFFLANSAKIFGLTPLQAFDACVWGSLFVFALCVGWLGIKKGLLWPGGALFALVWSCDSIFSAHYAYVRQASSIAFIALGAVLMNLPSPHAAETRLEKVSYWAGFLCLVTAGLFHLFSAVLAFIIIFSNIDRGAFKRNFLLPITLVVVAMVAGVRFYYQPKPIFDNMAWQVTSVWEWAYDLVWVTTFEKWESFAYFWGGLALAAVLVWSPKRNRAALALCMVLLVLLLPIWKQEFLGYAFRFMRSSGWIFPLGAALAMRSPGKFDRWTAYTVVACAFSGILFVQRNIENRQRYIGPGYSIEPLAENQEALRSWLDPDAFVIAPHGVQFRLTYFLKRASAIKPPTQNNYKALYRFGSAPSGMWDCYPVQLFAAAPMQFRCLSIPGNMIIERLN